MTRAKEYKICKWELISKYISIHIYANERLEIHICARVCSKRKKVREGVVVLCGAIAGHLLYISARRLLSAFTSECGG